MKRLDDKDDEKYVKALVYGHPGTGKTSFGVTAPDALIALTERQGMTHIREAVRRTGCAMPQVVLIETANDMRNLVRSLYGSREQPFRVYEMHENPETKAREKICVHEGPWPKSLVLDSATDFCRLLIEEIRHQSPQTLGKDGLPVDSQRFWNVLIQRAQSAMLAIRDLPMHAIFLALADDRTEGDDDNKVRSLKPSMATRQLSSVLAAAVNVVGYTYRNTKRGRDGQQNKVVYGIQTTGPEFMMTKPYRPLRDEEVPDFAYWVRVIRGEVSELQPAPQPSQELGGQGADQADKPLAGEPQPEPGAGPGTEPPAAPPEGAEPPADPKPKTKKSRRVV